MAVSPRPAGRLSFSGLRGTGTRTTIRRSVTRSATEMLVEGPPRVLRTWASVRASWATPATVSAGCSSAAGSPPAPARTARSSNPALTRTASLPGSNGVKRIDRAGPGVASGWTAIGYRSRASRKPAVLTSTALPAGTSTTTRLARAGMPATGVGGTPSEGSVTVFGFSVGLVSSGTGTVSPS
ncbi:MAG: hypothetical protein R2719_05245 [Micropruina sp.]